MILEKPYYRKVLSDELKKRSERNSRYSLRAYARSIGVEVSSLSRIMSGKRKLSYKKARGLVERLELSPEQRRDFLNSVEMEWKASFGMPTQERESSLPSPA